MIRNAHNRMRRLFHQADEKTDRQEAYSSVEATLQISILCAALMLTCALSTLEASSPTSMQMATFRKFVKNVDNFSYFVVAELEAVGADMFLTTDMHQKNQCRENIQENATSLSSHPWGDGKPISRQHCCTNGVKSTEWRGWCADGYHLKPIKTSCGKGHAQCDQHPCQAYECHKEAVIDVADALTRACRTGTGPPGLRLAPIPFATPPPVNREAYICEAVIAYIYPLFPINKMHAWLTLKSDDPRCQSDVCQSLRVQISSPLAIERIAVYSVVCLGISLFGAIYVYVLMAVSPAKFSTVYFCTFTVCGAAPIIVFVNVMLWIGIILFFLAKVLCQLGADSTLYIDRIEQSSAKPILDFFLPTVAAYTWWANTAWWAAMVLMCCFWCNRSKMHDNEDTEQNKASGRDDPSVTSAIQAELGVQAQNLRGVDEGAGSGQANTMQVACPEGCAPGTTVQVSTQDGRQLQVQVPPGVAPGQIFTVAIPPQEPIAAAVVEGENYDLSSQGNLESMI